MRRCPLITSRKPRGALRCNTGSAVRFFNTEGPIVPGDHYHIAPLSRIDLEQTLLRIQRKKYLVLRAPRQTGKTSVLLALARHLNSAGRLRCLYVNIESVQTAHEDVDLAIRTVLSEIANRASVMLADDSGLRIRTQVLAQEPPNSALRVFLSRWSESSRRPLVLFLDEIDTLEGDSLISVLRQLRGGYDLRPAHAPQSVILCGVRDVRDFRIYSSREGTHVMGGSAFNIKAESLRLGDFSGHEVRDLLAQHTEETGQVFEEPAIDRIWELTLGQPWLVNAIAYQSCFRNPGGRDRGRPIALADVDRAKEQLILTRATHLDQLADKLREERVRRVIEPVLVGDSSLGSLAPDDLEYARDLGLVRLDGQLRISNAIYQEVIPRQLTFPIEVGIDQDAAWYVKPDGGLDMPKLIRSFQVYFREQSDTAFNQEAHPYREAWPQLLLQAFLNRVVHSGGRIEREYALGRRRTDLLVIWPSPRDRAPGTEFRFVIECKVLRTGQSANDVIGRGAEQTAAYMDRCGADSGHLVVFDRREGRTWKERIFQRERRVDDRPVTIWGV